MCFMNHVYLCFFPVYTSYGLQPLDNRVFNAMKATYQAELRQLAVLTDAAPMDKINFIRCYSRARTKGMTEQNIKSSFRTTGNWLVSR